MLLLPVEEFIAEVRSEIIGYEELGEPKADEWEHKFNTWLNNKKQSSKNIKLKNGKLYYSLRDELELFNIVDTYLYAIENGEEDIYWGRME